MLTSPYWNVTGHLFWGLCRTIQRCPLFHLSDAQKPIAAECWIYDNPEDIYLGAPDIVQIVLEET